MRLLVHYELGNTALLESLLKSTRQFLQKYPVPFRTGKVIVKYLAKAIRQDDPEKKRLLFQQLARELQGLSREASEQWAYGELNFAEWAHKKSL